MSLLTTTSLIVVWCTLEGVNSYTGILQPPIGNQQYVLTQPQDASSYPVSAGYQLNATHSGNQDGEGDANHKEGTNPYTILYMEKDQVRCEECDENGNIRGNMTFVDGKLQKIRTVKYETKDVSLDPNAQEAGANPAQPSFSGAQEGYQQPQLIQSQQLQQMQPTIQDQQLPTMQLQPAYQGQPIQAQGQSYQGNQAVFGPVNNYRTNYPLIQQQNPIAPQLPVSLIAPSQPPQNVLGAVQPPNNFVSNPYAYATSPSIPFASDKQPEAATPGIFGPRPIDALAAEAIRNMQPQQIQTSVPTIQALIHAQPQPAQPQGLNDYGFGNLARRFNFMNSNGVDDKPQGPSILSSPSYQQSLFSTTGTGVSFNRDQNGAYDFMYKTPDSSRQEVADAKNNVIGSYAYRDPNGGIHNIGYSSGAQGFNTREQSSPATHAPSVMPAIILVPSQQRFPFSLVAARTSPILTGSSSDSVDKTFPKDEESAKPSDTDLTEIMLQKLAKQIVNKMDAEKSGASEGNVSSQPMAEVDQTPEAR